MKKIKVISLLITISVMALIFFFSSQTSDESMDTSNGIIQRMVEFFVPDYPEIKKEEIVASLSHFVRKVAHFTIFAVLGVSVTSTVKSFFDVTDKQVAKRSFAVCVIYACSDEIHQGLVSGRSMLFSDVLIDSAGAMAGIFVFFILYKLFKVFILNTERGL